MEDLKKVSAYIHKTNNSWKVEKCGWSRKICLQSCALERTYLLSEVAFIASKTSRAEEQKASPSVSPCEI